jgi:hypothetical protein
MSAESAVMAGEVVLNWEEEGSVKLWCSTTGADRLG